MPIHLASESKGWSYGHHLAHLVVAMALAFLVTLRRVQVTALDGVPGILRAITDIGGARAVDTDTLIFLKRSGAATNV